MNPGLQQKITLAVATLALWLPLPATAQERTWYQVEMLVFEHLAPRYDGEYWFKNPGLAPLADSVVLRERAPVTPAAAKEETAGPDQRPTPAVDEPGPAPAEPDPPPLVPYSFLPENSHRLGNIYRMMRQSRDYRPHYHVSWLQPAVDGAASRSVHVQARRAGNVFELTMPPLLVTDPMPPDFYEPIELIFDGTVRIRSSMYLHVDVDVVLFQPPPFLVRPEPIIDDPELILKDPDRVISDRLLNGPELTAAVGDSVPLGVENPVDYVRLTETRRLRLNELHYFDHPMFGMILQVSRYEREEE